MQTWNFSFDIVCPRLIIRQSMSLDCRVLGVVSPERTFTGTGAHWCRTKRLSGSPRKIIVVAASRLCDTRIVDQLLCARSHEKFAIGSVPRQAPTLEDLVASATEQCAPALVKVRRRLTTSDWRQTKIAFQLGSCLDRLLL